jgi:hypothetical protein
MPRVTTADIDNDTGSSWDTYTLAVGLTAVQAKATAFPVNKGVGVKAWASNTGIIYVGSRSNLTAGTTAATDGFPLSKGDGDTIPIDDLSKVWAISDTAGQNLAIQFVQT